MNSKLFGKYYIGLDENNSPDVTYDDVARQINFITENTVCAVTWDDETLDWISLNDPVKQTSVFRFVLVDRMERDVGSVPLPWLPPFCIVTVIGGYAVRVEVYGGETSYRLMYDIRADEFYDIDIAPSYEV